MSFGPQLPVSASGRLVASKGARHDTHHLRSAHGKARDDHPAREAPVLGRPLSWYDGSNATRRLIDVSSSPRDQVHVNALSPDLPGAGEGNEILRHAPTFKADVEAPTPQPTLVLALPGVEPVAVARGPADLASTDAYCDAVEVPFLLARRKI